MEMFDFTPKQLQTMRKTERLINESYRRFFKKCIKKALLMTYSDELTGSKEDGERPVAP